MITKKIKYVPNDENNINKEYILTSNYNNFSISKIQAFFIMGLLEKYRPNNICEYGAGDSTKIFEIYSQKYNKTFLNIEQVEKYLYNISKHFPINNAFLAFNNITYEKHIIYDGFFFENKIYQ